MSKGTLHNDTSFHAIAHEETQALGLESHAHVQKEMSVSDQIWLPGIIAPYSAGQVGTKTKDEICRCPL